MFLVLAILPIFSFIILVVLNNDIISLLNNSLIFIEIVTYVVYLVILNTVLRG
jgi:hypothetical protein